MILSNQALCLICEERPFSANRHDHKSCSCGNVSVDGGMSYIRHSYKDKSKYVNLSVEWSGYLLDIVLESVEEMIATRNSLGVVCAVARGIRDAGHEVKQKPMEG